MAPSPFSCPCLTVVNMELDVPPSVAEIMQQSDTTILDNKAAIDKDDVDDLDIKEELAMIFFVKSVTAAHLTICPLSPCRALNT